MPVYEKSESYIRTIVKLSMYIVLLVTIPVLVIWLINPSLFTQLLPQSTTMKVNTAILFIAVGTGVYVYNHADLSESRWLNFISILIVLMAGSTLLSYLIDAPFVIDELLIKDPLTPIDQYPGRMSEATAFMFTLFGIALLIHQRLPQLSELLAMSINLMGLIAVFTYLFDVQALYSIFFFSTMSIHTSFLFVMLSSVYILTIPDGKVHGLIILDEPGGITFRALLPIILIVPFISGWLVLQGLNAGLYQPAFAIVLMVALIVIAQFVMALFFADNIQSWYQRFREQQKEFMNTKITLLELENIREVKEFKEDFFAKLSHDMRQPITRIVSSSDILIRHQAKLTPEQHSRHANQIQRQAMMMLDFMDDIMLLSHMEMDEVPFAPQTVDIVATVRGCCEVYEDYYTETPHQIVTTLPTYPIDVSLDPKLIHRLLGNLVNNAIKYSPHGGTVEIKVAQADTTIDLSVRDEGIGIPAEDMDNLFTMFRRATNVENIKGHGLGLSIVKQIADLHDATIDIESIVGHGTTFTVRLHYP